MIQDKATQLNYVIKTAFSMILFATSKKVRIFALCFS